LARNQHFCLPEIGADFIESGCLSAANGAHDADKNHGVCFCGFV